ncbi:hypothetical protein KUH03_16805 [Sphingobacterium sp. E70]|uniref:hypothetical protein n=1 Tax=Sphingobacterium sp. E70 TaxID=2853439 RepID=UPI00211B8C79|nr:hypothetical protein [Sphingobacterium sp. E70]ULT28109.1 hypothetical protein KUH03_16805 [Sphingobacterium sp. E70]
MRDSLNTSNIETLPLVSITQMLKGQIAGLYVQEATGEPGAPKNMVLRGLGSPLLKPKMLSTFNRQFMSMVYQLPGIIILPTQFSNINLIE